MSGLVVGGVTIPIASSAVSRGRADWVDRSRSFDGTYRSSLTGGAAREWTFSTPAVTRALADTYEIVLATVAAQTCSGDILSLPMMCCSEITGWTPVATPNGHYVVIDFVLHEAQPARVLLKYSPGDTITGESFTRATTGYYRGLGAGGGVDVKAINVKRDVHYPGGVAPKTLLLEDTRTNLITYGSDFSNVIWTNVTMTVGTGISDPAGGTAACTLTAAGATSEIYQAPATSSNIIRTASCWIKRRTGTGVVKLVTPDGARSAALAVTSTWTRFSAQGASSVDRYCGIQIVTSADAVDVWCPQTDDSAYATSEIPTATIAVSRAADFYSLPFTVPPLEASVYLKFVEGGTITAASKYLFSISNATPDNPSFSVDVNAGVYRVGHGNGTTTVLASLAVAPAVGDTVEILARLYGDGSIDITQSINSGASTSSAQSAANAFSSAWSGLLCWLNSAGTAATSIGYTSLQSFKIVAGARSLAEMRAL